MSEIADQVIEPTSGQIIKYIGDAILIAFPEDDADAGVDTMMELQRRLHAEFEQLDLPTRVSMGLHVGEVVVGRMKPIDTPDIFGEAVDRAVTIDRRQHRGRVVISPETFRRLAAATRKAFHKFTPPMVYVAEE